MMKSFIFLLFSLLCLAPLSAQQEVAPLFRMQGFLGINESLPAILPQEKVYLHFDNTGYFLGETIWFKAYVVESTLHAPTAGSGVLYVELLNSKGKVLETKKLKIEHGGCHGEFYLNNLNVEYFPGIYEVRAYTRAMLNFGEEIVFSRSFPVFNYVQEGDYQNPEMKVDNFVKEINLKNHRKKEKKEKNVNLSFYPEGGQLVEGLLSQVAFRLTDQNGSPLEGEGIVLNSDNEQVATFSTQHAGMGVFPYIPEKKKCRVEVLINNRKHRFDLPQALPEGYTLTANNLSDKQLLVQVEQSSSLPQSPLGLSVQCRGQFSVFEVLEDELSLIIPKEILPSGVNVISLFDAKGTVLCERMIFVYPREEEITLLTATPDKDSYKPLEQVTIDFALSGNLPAKPFTFSLAVWDKETTPDAYYKEGLFSYLLLSSEIRGIIDNPAYYFEDTDASRRYAMDLLLLVQGWRRYDWSLYSGKEKFTPTHDLEEGLVIKGQLVGSGRKQAEVKVHMSDGKDFLMRGVAESDDDGIFYLYPEDYLGTWNLTLNCSAIKEGGKNIRLDRWFSPSPRIYDLRELRWKMNERIEESIEDDDAVPTWKLSVNGDSIAQTHIIEEVQIKREDPGRDLIYNVGRDVDRMRDTGERLPSIVHDYLLLKNNGYVFEDWSDLGSEPFFSCELPQFLPPNPAFIMYWMNNEILGENDHRKIALTSNILEVNEIRINDLLKPYKKDRLGDTRLYYKIIVYFYEDYRMRTLENTRHTSFDGFSPAKSFYEENRSIEELQAEAYNTKRTLYWNPNVEIDGDGKASVSFYNNLICKSFEISTEGLMPEGILLK